MEFKHFANEDLMTLLHNAINHPNKERAKRVKESVYAVWKKRNQQFCSGKTVKLMQNEGVLSAFRYKVGDGGITSALKRQEILDHLLEAPIPPLVDREYTKKWGAPNTQKRKSTLFQTIKSLAAGARNRTNTQAAYSRARNHWEADMSYLKGVFAQTN